MMGRRERCSTALVVPGGGDGGRLGSTPIFAKTKYMTNMEINDCGACKYNRNDWGNYMIDMYGGFFRRYFCLCAGKF